MPAYMLVEVAIHSLELYEEYKKMTPTSLLPFDGKFLVRGGPVEALEGSWDHDRLVILEFPSKEKALAWYHSPEYQEAKQVRDCAASARFLLIGD
uniref:DUF1330 domain-containing protein n=1 Tax=Algoriphagus sp. TaxID=1872435 RepID=UPI0040473B4B